ncbi:MAG: serine protein kinase RIO [Candidatus Micrarchaeaceae archaeon]|jgi:RIO kinase 1
MARRLGRRKRPTREKHMLREQNKIEEGIFDNKTMMFLSKLFNKGIIERLIHIIARGKEADVYIASPGSSKLLKGSRYVVVKFFRVETSSFLKMSDYIIGDTRFENTRLSKGSIVTIWCRKEFGNLKIAEESGICAPTPYLSNGSILAMQFIGDKEGVPAPQLKNVRVPDPEKFLETIIDQIRSLYRNNLVHADLSEFNILCYRNRPYFIDFGQAVVTRHPNSAVFLERDVKTVLRYFEKHYGVKRDYESTIRFVTAK